jgi:hypothetical protein
MTATLLHPGDLALTDWLTILAVLLILVLVVFLLLRFIVNAASPSEQHFTSMNLRRKRGRNHGGDDRPAGT